VALVTTGRFGINDHEQDACVLALLRRLAVLHKHVERQPPCPRATTILAGFQAAEVGVSFNVSG
jgi:hypothetical protein